MFNTSVWPPSCPPSDAHAPDGLTVYRIVKSDPPSPGDFQSYFQAGIAVAGGAQQQCKSRSLSVFMDLNEAMALARGTQGKIGTMIAEGILRQNDGVVEPSRRTSHVSWWLCDEIAEDPKQMPSFRVIATI